jgi:hypothetical protein
MVFFISNTNHMMRIFLPCMTLISSNGVTAIDFASLRLGLTLPLCSRPPEESRQH